MENLWKILKIFAGIGALICIGIPLFLCIAAIISVVMWPIWIVLRLYEKIAALLVGGYAYMKSVEHTTSESLLEFIFLCYGFAALFIYASLSIFDESI